MPEYLEMLRMADLEKVFGEQFFEIFKNCGPLCLLALLSQVAAISTLGAALALSRLRLYKLVLIFSGIGAAIGWFGSYAGYMATESVVNSSITAPKHEDLVGAANQMAWSALVPTIIAVTIVLIAAAAYFVVRSSKKSVA